MPAFASTASPRPLPDGVLSPRRALAVLAATLLVLGLSACGGKGGSDPTGRADGKGGSEQLPAPTGTAGGVTGMPTAPGPGHVGPPTEEMAEGVVLDENGNPLPPALGPDGEPLDPATLPAAAMPPGAEDALPLPPEPTPEDAVAVVRDYYAALNGGDFPRAHAMWADEGRASGQSATQFAAGFADATGISVEVMPPGRIDAGAGQRHIEVPVAYTVTLRDGSLRRYVGAYTLRRTVVDGASAEQRAWRIGSADIRQLDR
ncbi:hypothetical protein [Agrilutibacter solisilvae]|uniref:hypothetical protein n=1 Tax=Agrilutibacter solisilvae TaxID=2763317 RepID=UPI001FD63C32|nr:hypothetical protein [Lysobacter solisilvae]